MSVVLLLLSSKVEQKVANYFPEEASIFSQSEFEQVMSSFPDSRNYIDYESFEGACISNYPDLEEDYIIASRVLSTIIAQETEKQLDSYEEGVIRLIRDSSIPKESKEGLIGTVSVQKASREFWYD